MVTSKKSQIHDRAGRRVWLLVWWTALICSSGLISVWAYMSGVALDRDLNYGLWLSSFDGLIRAGEMMPYWLKGLTFGNGLPVFVFYPPLFYYVAELPRLMGATLAMSLSAAVTISVVGSFISMYFLGKEWFGKWGGLASAVFYTTVPYHFALIYHRGGLAENLAYALYPVIVLSLWRIFKDRNWRDGIWLGLAFGTILLANIPATFVAVCVALVLIMVWSIVYRHLPFIGLAVGGVTGLVLSSFYWFPMIASLRWVDVSYFVTSYLGFNVNYDVVHQFAKLSAFSLWMPPEITGTMQANYYVGTIQWLVVAGAIGWLVANSTRLERHDKRIVLALLALLVLALIMMLPSSRLLWDNIVIIKYIQYPLRWMSVIALVASCLAGYVMTRLSLGLFVKVAIFVGVVTQIIVLWTGLPKPVEVLDDAGYSTYGFLKTHVKLQSDAIGDSGSVDYPPVVSEPGYLPRTAKLQAIVIDYVENVMARVNALSITGAANYTVPVSQLVDTIGALDAVVEDVRGVSFRHAYGEATEVIYRQLAFPGWRVMIDGNVVKTDVDISTGRIKFIVPAGTHAVRVRYTLPDGAILGRWISLSGLVALICVWVWSKRRV